MDELEKAKEQAKKDISLLDGLSVDDKKNYYDSVDKSTTVEDVNQVVNQAKQQNNVTIQKKKNDLLLRVKNSQHLSDDRKKYYTDELNKATTMNALIALEDAINKEETPMDKQAWINQKLATLNKKPTAMNKHLELRVVAINQ